MCTYVHQGANCLSRYTNDCWTPVLSSMCALLARATALVRPRSTQLKRRLVKNPCELVCNSLHILVSPLFHGRVVQDAYPKNNSAWLNGDYLIMPLVQPALGSSSGTKEGRRDEGQGLPGPLASRPETSTKPNQRAQLMAQQSASFWFTGYYYYHFLFLFFNSTG